MEDTILSSLSRKYVTSFRGNCQMEIIFHLTDPKVREQITHFYENLVSKRNKVMMNERNKRMANSEGYFILFIFQMQFCASYSFRGTPFLITYFYSAGTLVQTSPNP